MRKNCLECGNIFISTTSRNRKYCDDECKHSHLVKSLPKVKIHVCRTCGIPTDERSVTMNYCSRSCQSEMTNKTCIDVADQKRLRKLLKIYPHLKEKFIVLKQVFNERRIWWPNCWHPLEVTSDPE